MPESFSDTLWASVASIYDAILAHPFLAGLTDGSLDRDRFGFYVVQDAHFLREYGRALSVAAARAPSERDIAMFNRHAVDALKAERSLHESFFAELGMSEADVAATPLAPTTVAYTSFLLASAYGGSFPEALGALLPCYWIYWEVGKELAALGSGSPLYSRWIDTYASDEFAAVAGEVIALADGIGPELTAPERQRVGERFITASRYEWMFWDMAWRLEEWPPPSAAPA